MAHLCRKGMGKSLKNTIIVIAVIAMTMLSACSGNAIPKPPTRQSDNINVSALELVAVTLDEAWLIMKINNPHIEYEPERVRFLGDGTITNVQGEILEPSEGLSSRLIEEAEFPDVYLFEIDGSDFDGNYQANHYAVTKMGGILYVNESVTNTYGRDDVWVALTGGFVPLDNSAKLTELVLLDADSTGLTFTLRNATNQDFNYGQSFRLLVKDGREWSPVEASGDGTLMFTLEAYTVTSQSQTLPIKVDFEWRFGDLPQGEYKFIKDVMDFRGTGDFDNYDLEQTFAVDTDKR